MNFEFSESIDYNRIRYNELENNEVPIYKNPISIA